MPLSRLRHTERPEGAVSTLLDLRNELDTLCRRYDRIALAQLALMLSVYLDEARGPSVLDREAAGRYAEIFVAAVELLDALTSRRSKRVLSARDKLQARLEDGLPDVQPYVNGNPHYRRT